MVSQESSDHQLNLLPLLFAISLGHKVGGITEHVLRQVVFATCRQSSKLATIAPKADTKKFAVTACMSLQNTWYMNTACLTILGKANADSEELPDSTASVKNASNE